MNYKKKIMYISFKDIIDDDNCVVKFDGKKKLIPRAKIMKQIIKDKADCSIIIKQRDQWLVDPFYYGGILTGIDVYKFIVLFDNGDKIIIKDVSETDIYFEELRALSKYKVRLVLKDDEIYPDFPKSSDYEYQEYDDKKRK